MGEWLVRCRWGDPVRWKPNSVKRRSEQHPIVLVFWRTSLSSKPRQHFFQHAGVDKFPACAAMLQQNAGYPDLSSWNACRCVGVKSSKQMCWRSLEVPRDRGCGSWRARQVKGTIRSYAKSVSRKPFHLWPRLCKTMVHDKTFTRRKNRSKLISVNNCSRVRVQQSAMGIWHVWKELWLRSERFWAGAVRSTKVGAKRRGSHNRRVWFILHLAFSFHVTLSSPDSSPQFPRRHSKQICRVDLNHAKRRVPSIYVDRVFVRLVTPNRGMRGWSLGNRVAKETRTTISDSVGSAGSTGVRPCHAEAPPFPLHDSTA